MNDAINKANDQIRREKIAERFDRIASARLNKTPEEKLVIERDTFLFGSYAANVFSILTAFYAVYYTTTDYSLVKAAIVGVVGFAVLVVLETVKRHSVISIARNTPIAYLPLFLAVGVSMSISYYGGSKFITEEATEVQKEVNPEIAELRAEVESINQHDAEMIATWKKWENKETKKWPVAAFRYMTEGEQKDANSRRTTLLTRIDELKAADETNWATMVGKQQFRLTNLGYGSGSLAVLCDVALFFLLFGSEKREQEITALKRSKLRPVATGQKAAIPNAGSAAPVANAALTDLEYRKRTGRYIAELREELETLKKENEKMKSRTEPDGTNPTELTTEKRPTDAKASEKTERKPTQKRRRKPDAKQDAKRKCLHCKTDISHRTKRAKYCSDACRKDYHETKT